MAYKIGSITCIDDLGQNWMPDVQVVLHAGYVMAGYRSSLLHNKLNKATYGTDTTTTLSATTSHIANYLCGSSGPTRGIAWGVGSTGATGVGVEDSGTNILTFSTETIAVGPTMQTTRAYHEAVTFEGIGGYTTGGTDTSDTTVDKWAAASNTISSATTVGTHIVNHNHAFTGNRLRGFWNYDGTAGRALTFSTETWSASTGHLGPHDSYTQALAVSTRIARGYCIGSWSDTDHNSHKCTINGTAVTTTSIGTVPSRIEDGHGNSETNALMGNNYSRALGGYSAGTIGQHSLSCKIAHSNDAFVDVSGLDIPNAGSSYVSGRYGCSSGATVWV